jgi:hypothetical protein
MVGVFHQLVGALLQGTEAPSGAVLDHELEAAGSPETLHRRRGDDEDLRLADGAEPLSQRRQQLGTRRPVDALLEGLRTDEDGAGVRAVGARVARITSDARLTTASVRSSDAPSGS